MPDWVKNYVIVHELTEKYKLKERAIGYLMAKGFREEESDIDGF